MESRLIADGNSSELVTASDEFSDVGTLTDAASSFGVVARGGIFTTSQLMNPSLSLPPATTQPRIEKPTWNELYIRLMNRITQ